jgi:hypothetical protein
MFNKNLLAVLIAAVFAVATATTAMATGIMPDFANVPTGWTTDRYDPASFTNVGPYQGRFNALGIGIDASTSTANRPPNFASAFYNTQGRQFSFSPNAGPGSILTADLFVPASWASEANGAVRTDMWAVGRNAGDVISLYSIFGFTNYNGGPRFRAWDNGIWVDLPNTINYNAWNRFTIELMPDTSVRYFVNGVLSFTDTDTGLTVGFSATIMQAYNFGDPGLVPAPLSSAAYTAHWANSALVVDDDGQASATDCDATDAAFNTIQGAVNTAPAGADIKVCPGTYNESLAITKSVTLQSTGGSAVTTIALLPAAGSGTPYGSIFINNAAAAVSIDGFTIRGNDAVGAGLANSNMVINAASSVSLSNSVVKVGARSLTNPDFDNGLGIVTNYNAPIGSITVSGTEFSPTTTSGERAFYLNPGVINFVFQNNQILGHFTRRHITEARTNTVTNNVMTGAGPGAANVSGGFGVDNDVNDPAQTSTFTGNTVSNVSAGLWIGYYTAPQNVTVTGNAFINSLYGVSVYPGASGITLEYNRIVGNSVAGVRNQSSGFSAANNWWGCNYGPGASGAGCPTAANGVTGTVSTSPWLILTTSASPNAVLFGGNATVTSALTINSASVNTAGGGNVPNGTPATFAGTLGTVAPPSNVTTSGVTSTVFTAGMMQGVGATSTTIDGQTTSVNIPIYPASCAALSMPVSTTLTGVPHTVPVNTTEMTGRGALSADFRVTYDPAVLQLAAGPNFGVTLGPVGVGRVLTVNQPVLGTLIISVFGPTELTGNGALVNLNFNVIGLPFDVSALNFTSFTYNEGVPCSGTTNGSVTVIGGTITGNVTYGNALVNPGIKPIPNVTVTGTGTPTVFATTNTAGDYSLSGFGPGSYSRSAAKTGGIPAGTISAFDSAMIAQYVVQLISLSTNQQTVADVSGAGGITSFDAALIARYTVLLTGSGSTGDWLFTPTQYGPSAVWANITGENYVGLLMGDVSGNWNQNASEPGGRPGSVFGEDSSRKTLVTAPTVEAKANTKVEVPVMIRGTKDKGIVSYNFTLRYDPSVITPMENPVSLDETVSSRLVQVVNAEEPGVLRVAVFGPMPIDADGTLIKLMFRAIGSAGSSTDLTWEDLLLNEGVERVAVDGQVLIGAGDAQDEINGRVLTATGDRVSKAVVTITDPTGKATTVTVDRTGSFRFSGAEKGQTYTITVNSGRHSFTPLNVSVVDGSVSIDIIAAQ